MIKTPDTGDKCVFLDKDGTLIKDIPYNVDVSRIELLDGVIEGLKALRSHGFRLVVISNQPGVALGYFNPAALDSVKTKLFELCSASGIGIEAFYYCPHDADDNCSCRKPQAGLIMTAAQELNIDLTRSWMVGDILNDVEAGNRAGCRTVLVDNGNETEWLTGAYRTPDYTAGSLNEASQYIVMKDKKPGNETKLERY